MRRVLITIGAALVATTYARADAGIALKVDRNRVTVRVATMTVRLGERVALTVFPYRGEGVGEGIVTDFDPNTDRIGLVLTPKIDHSYRFLPNRNSRRTRGSGMNEVSFRLSEGDAVSIDGLHEIVADHPNFTLEIKEWRARPTQTDLYLSAVSLSGRNGYSVVPGGVIIRG